VTKKKPAHLKKKPGVKPKPIDLDVAYEKAKEGADMMTIQQAIGRSPNQSNFSNLQAKHPQLKQAIKQGREENIQAHIEHLIPKAQWAMKEILSNPDHPGFTAATIFLHKTIMGLRETNKVEVSGEISHVHQLDPAQRAEKIRLLKKELEEQAIDVMIEPEVIDDPKGT
jgi:hypothetical protein